MNRYVFEDLVMNPETPDLEGLIGKEVYFCTVPLDCLKRANTDYEIGILREIRKGLLCPFFVEVPNGMIINYACIIPKKEEPKSEQTLPESAEDFVERSMEVKEQMELSSFESSLL